MLESDFKELIRNVKEDILSTRYKIMENANFELLNLYFRLGKIISENMKYGNNFIDNLTTFFKLEFPNMKGLKKEIYQEWKHLMKNISILRFYHQ